MPAFPVTPSAHQPDTTQVVTGVGKHSQGGQPRILPAIVRVLMAAGLTFRSQPGNAGVIEVHLPGQPLTQGLRAGRLEPGLLELATPEPQQASSAASSSVQTARGWPFQSPPNG